MRPALVGSFALAGSVHHIRHPLPTYNPITGMYEKPRRAVSEPGKLSDGNNATDTKT